MKKWMLLTDDDSEGLKESPKKLKLRRIIKGNNDDETIGRVTAFKKLFYGFFNNFFSISSAQYKEQCSLRLNICL